MSHEIGTSVNIHVLLFITVDYDMIYMLTAIGFTPGSISTVQIYTQTVHRTTQRNRIPRTEHT